ncbi:MAG: FtsQ-type POTRA domain-containing protein [Chthoniobacteraceae bacterium]
MSKVRNQRLSTRKVRKHQHLLEVSARADKARTMRNRFIAMCVCKTLFYAGIATGVWLGGNELLRRFLLENPEYALTDIRVSTDGALQRDQIILAGGVRAGVNIFRVKTEPIREGIDKLPQVERAEIQIIRPNRLDIVVTERRPIAWVTERADEIPTASGKSWLIDARGVVMRTKRMIEEYYHLPHISGVPVGDFVSGQRVATVEMQSALELVRLDAANTRWQARNIDLSKGYCLIVTDQNHAKVTFGLDGIEQQLDRLFRYLDRADAEKKELLTVNLLVRKNTPVTFHKPEEDDPAPTPAPPSPPAQDKPKAKSTPMPVKVAVAVAPRAVAVPTPTPAATKTKSDSRSNSRTKSTPTVRKPFRS